MNDSEKQLGEMIKKARKEHQWTANQLAEQLGVSTHYVRNLECGKCSPSLKVFCKAMRLLGLSADDYVYPERAESLTSAEM
ncbi:MAG: helix-turn-helix domain-containing protein [Lachnospiraceae bacterium]|nr:helix-turn-helix domain-containing protein [Lachnospiraceae bacterium]